MLADAYMLTCPNPSGLLYEGVIHFYDADGKKKKKRGIKSSKKRRCGFVSPLDNWEVGGMCDGQVMCPMCWTIVDIETGREAAPCGDCEFCDIDKEDNDDA